MTQSMPPGHRFSEVQDLLASYADSGFAFTDTPDTPGPGLSSYIRVVLLDRERGAEAVRQLDDLLSLGVFAEEIADDVELFPRVAPPPGMSVDECLRLARDHIANSLEHPDRYSLVPPRSGWEWEERFPALEQLLGIYFNQDFADFYSSHAEALNSYLSGMTMEDFRAVVREIPEVLSIVSSEEELWNAAQELGLEVYPPKGRTLSQWLLDVRAAVEQHLRGRPT